MNLDRWRDDILNNPPDIKNGIWYAQGFLEECTAQRIDPDGGVTTLFYNFSGVGGPEEAVDRDGFDYYEYPVMSRSEAPLRWNGMSGCGAWRVPIKRENGTLIPQRPVLSGILFYQRETTPAVCGVVAHGPKSIYALAYDAIVGFKK